MTVEEARAAWRAYKASADRDFDAMRQSGALDVLGGITSETERLLKLAGRYAEGRAAADEEAVGSADSFGPAGHACPEPTDELFAAGWADRMSER